MNLVEVRQNWPKNLVRIDLEISNICNYKCWYCWPGSNKGNYKFPEFDLYVKNLSHLLDHYLTKNPKTKFDFHVVGGEVTHWKRFIEFISVIKEKYDCIFSLTSNGSKSLEWWKTASKYLDYVVLSSHNEYTDPAHLRDVADLLYKENVIVVVSVMMDPKAWNKCMDAVEYYKKSKRRWSIYYSEIIDQGNNIYTQEQQTILSKRDVRNSNIFYYLRNNKSYRSVTTIIDDAGKNYRVTDSQIVLDRLNNFKGWQCMVGVLWVDVKYTGDITGICGNSLYDQTQSYNIFDVDFVEKFKPVIEPTICNQDSCWCTFEAKMPKRKVIPIYEN